MVRRRRTAEEGEEWRWLDLAGIGLVLAVSGDNKKQRRRKALFGQNQLRL